MHGAAEAAATPLEIWGGVEYTHNRVCDQYFDQMEKSGHLDRVSDMELFAALGITTLRAGLLWERFEKHPSWARTDHLLFAMRLAGMRPIAGLMHHGSGPRDTSLLDAAFPSRLAGYARKVAERYPWIDAYTPVNEINTTARFSALYGIWYPHAMSRKSYLRAVLNQARATVLSMQAVREVNPEARLVATDDLGGITGTEEMRSTTELLQERRWLAFDLLCGVLDRNHPLYNYILEAGVSERELMWFADHPCPPSVIGANYYLTSDRYLDHQTERYTVDRRSAEGPYADIEAVRVCSRGVRGFEAVLAEAWNRYRLPVAITEVHLGGPVADRIRWFSEAWSAAQKQREEGAHCVAVTAWALLGSYFWNELVTRDNGHYEPGVFDLRSGTPRATELAEVIAQASRQGHLSHPALAEEGWWRHPSRLWTNQQEREVTRRAA